MAIEAERLLAIFEARFSSLEKALSKARTDANKSFGDIEAAGTRAENTLAAIGNRGLPGMAKLNSSLGRTRMETANVAAQFQDIGVQLAGGTSPFLIAIQQGTQLNQVLGQAGAKGAVSLLGGAFMSLLNPVSLATIAIIGLGGTAVQYFAEWLSKGELTEQQLREHQNLVRDVAAKWGNAIPALQAYIAELEKADAKAKLIATSNQLAAEQYDPLRDALRDINAEIAAAAADLQAVGASESSITALRAAFASLNAAVDENSDSSDEYKALQEQVAAILRGEMSPSVEALSALLDANAAAFAKAAASAGQLKEEAAAAVLQLNALGSLSPLMSGGGKFLNPEEFQNYKANQTKSQYQIEKSRSSGSRSSAASEADREREAVVRLIEQLEFERSLIGLSNEEREKEVALRRAGAAATPEQKARIEELTEAIQREEAALKASKEAADARNDSLEYLFELGADGITALAEKSANAEEAIKRLAIQLALAVAQAALLGTGPLAGLFNSGWGSVSLHNLPGNANGTNNWRGGLTRVNERGGEVMNLPRGTQIIPHDVSVKALRAASGSSPISVDARTTIDARGADQAAIARFEAAQRQRDAEFPARVVRTIRDAKKQRIL